ncbi:MAG: bifunctional diaminohydroxyphosphoribosylaminopyrimidine deaminase/5-amino-6-(5-phosphoribosylamino)uracil reductase RibD [Rubrivivax sp.]|nr:bifunctional diaminohydroxyphosphoribosylaminopyrimidine deaminase/5-amino-6-(5-phosphoribosylamino)uracil reductase RibD [Rubrivivax sp.]
MALTPLDAERLDEAIALAQQAIGLSDPNPRVGCVIGREDGTVLGRGSTQRAGEGHAEVMALRDAAGADLRGATAWVSLEPCSHHGRTPPCCDALVAAGIARVVAAIADPNPRVGGQGLQRLRAAGLRVETGDPDHAQAARELNIGFFARHERGRPWLRLKAAASLDGRTALEDGTSQWITGPEARADGHAWRRRAGAVVTGIGTVLQDDPRLDVRLVETALQPLRVVVDSSLRTPPRARLLSPPGRVLVVTGTDTGEAAARLREAGAEVLVLAGHQGRVDLHGLVAELGRREVNEVHLEAGAVLGGAFLQAGLVDELLIYQAPMLIGPGRGVVTWPALQALDAALGFEWVGQDRVGTDLRLRLRATGPRDGSPRRKH